MPETKPKRGRPPTTDAQELQDLAMRAYWHQGPCDVSINAICQLAQVSKPSLYRLFGNEDGLMDAALARYVDTVLANAMAILQADEDLETTLNALTNFACDDPRMAQDCLFNKMRANQHRLGPKTKARVAAIDAAASAAYAAFLQRCADQGKWAATLPLETAALYLKEQVALAITLRATGHPAPTVRAFLTAAFTAVSPD